MNSIFITTNKKLRNFLILLEAIKIVTENEPTKQDIDECIKTVKKFSRLIVLINISKHATIISCILVLASMVLSRHGGPNLTPFALILSTTTAINHLNLYNKLSQSIKQMDEVFPRIRKILDNNQTNVITK